MKPGLISTVIRLSRLSRLAGFAKFPMKSSVVGFPLVFFLVLLFGGWSLFLSDPASRTQNQQLSPPVVVSGDTLQAIQPLTPMAGLDPGRVALGERLFHDARLSADFSLACASCHNLGQGGVDGRKFSQGINGALGGVNAPTVLNAGYGIAQFWDGRAASLEEQAAGPIHNPIEMGSNWDQVLNRLGQDMEIRAAFKQLYPDGLTALNVADAIATFERSLVTVNSRFDRYLLGEKQILTPLEVEGYRRFREFGCTSCHQGVLLGGNMYQKFGVLGDYFAGRKTTAGDMGRYNVTHREEDKHVFKVPTLRNIALTAPYFHDGSADTLDQAITVMARYQLGRDISRSDVESIIAFLKTLNGDLPAGRS